MCLEREVAVPQNAEAKKLPHWEGSRAGVNGDSRRTFDIETKVLSCFSRACIGRRNSTKCTWSDMTSDLP